MLWPGGSAKGFVIIMALTTADNNVKVQCIYTKQRQCVGQCGMKMSVQLVIIYIICIVQWKWIHHDILLMASSQMLQMKLVCPSSDEVQCDAFTTGLPLNW